MTKRIAIAKMIDHAVNLNMINKEKEKKKEDKMTTQEIKKQINMQKIHNARTKRAKENLNENEKLHANYGGVYTQAESNLLCDLHPYFKKMKEAVTIKPEKLSEKRNI